MTKSKTEGEEAAIWLDPSQLSEMGGAPNPRRNDSAVAPLGASIGRFGFLAPIVARRSDLVIAAGHTRWKAALSRGDKRVRVVLADFDSDEELRAYRLADNGLAHLATWDRKALKEELRELASRDVPLSGLGWPREELSTLVGGTAQKGVRANEDRPVASRVGELYQLGPHLLWCGKWEGAPFEWEGDLLATDPPYGQDYSPKGGAGRRWSGEKIAGDDEPFDPGPLLELPVEHSILWGANWYANRLPPSSGWLVWTKEGDNSAARTAAAAELAWTDLGRPVARFHHLWRGMIRDSERGETHHPTPKPVALWVWALGLANLGAGGIVLDPYSGSGPLLLAAHTLGLIVRSAELDPRWVDAARRRWTELARSRGEDPGPGALE